MIEHEDVSYPSALFDPACTIHALPWVAVYWEFRFLGSGRHDAPLRRVIVFRIDRKKMVDAVVPSEEVGAKNRLARVLHCVCIYLRIAKPVRKRVCDRCREELVSRVAGNWVENPAQIYLGLIWLVQLLLVLDTTQRSILGPLVWHVVRGWCA